LVLATRELGSITGRGTTMAGVMLVGDPERERAVNTLRRHYVEGRLSSDELERRTAVALAARTRDDLRRLQRDLPLDLGRTIRQAARTAALGAIAATWFFLTAVLALALVVAEVADPGRDPAIVLGLAWVVTCFAAWSLARRVRAR
jgi:hypothetical protein